MNLKSSLLIFLLVILLNACGGVNLPAAKSFTCDCTPDSDEIRVIGEIAMKYGFLEDSQVVNASASIETWRLPLMRNRENKNFIITVGVRFGKFLITFSDNTIPIKFTAKEENILNSVIHSLRNASAYDFHQYTE
jgi:hypothetical protein